MSETIFLSVEAILGLHAEQIEEFGGAAELLNLGLLESAVNSVISRWGYDPDADLFELAATYAFAIGKNHPFADGNKRTAFAAAVVCLFTNGFALNATNEEAAQAVLDLVNSRVDRSQFSEFLFQSCLPVGECQE